MENTLLLYLITIITIETKGITVETTMQPVDHHYIITINIQKGEYIYNTTSITILIVELGIHSMH